MAVFEFPASAAQRRMWLLDQLDPGQPTYHVGFAVWLDGPLDPAALDGAWAAAVERHEILRTTFRANGGRPIQVIDDSVRTTGLEIVALDQLPEADRAAAAHAALREHARTPLPLDRGPLTRVRLLRLAPQRHVLALVAHHAIVDGWSFRLLLDEISADYEALCAGRPAVSVEPPCSTRTSPSGSGSTPTRAATPRRNGSGRPSWPASRRSCRSRSTTRTPTGCRRPPPRWRCPSTGSWPGRCAAWPEPGAAPSSPCC